MYQDNMQTTKSEKNLADNQIKSSKNSKILYIARYSNPMDISSWYSNLMISPPIFRFSVVVIRMSNIFLKDKLYQVIYIRQYSNLVNFFQTIFKFELVLKPNNFFHPIHKYKKFHLMFKTNKLPDKKILGKTQTQFFPPQILKLHKFSHEDTQTL